MNPFALEPTPEHLHFLHALVRVLLEGDDQGIGSATWRARSTERRERLHAGRKPAAALHGRESAASPGLSPSQVDRGWALRQPVDDLEHH